VMIIGEAPGRAEDESGQPFVGASGRFLNELLDAAGITRDECFITNSVKCRPPRNRTPRKEEVDTCVANYLMEQIELVNPKLIMLLGMVAAKKLLGVTKVGEARGRVFDRGRRKYLVGYHPSARPVFAEKIKQDFARLRRELQKL
jgi:uracil-DNA glycosylase family 4